MHSLEGNKKKKKKRSLEYKNPECLLINHEKELLHNRWVLSSYKQHNIYESHFVKNYCRLMMNDDSAADSIGQFNSVSEKIL